MCDRCSEPIRPDEDYDKFIPDSGTGAAPTVYTHRPPCKRIPTQTYPSTPFGR